MIKSFVEVQPSRKKDFIFNKENVQEHSSCWWLFFSLYTLATVKDIREGAEE